MKIWIIIYASSLALMVTGFYMMFAMPMIVQGSSQGSSQVADSEFYHRVPTYWEREYIKDKQGPVRYESPVTVLNPFGIVFIGTGIVLPLIVLEYHKERS